MNTRTLFADDDRHDSAERRKRWSVPSSHQRPSGAQTIPAPYQNGTLTSIAAAESARTSVTSQVMRVHDFITGKGEHGATDKEIQTALQLDGNSERPRRVWLRAHGFIAPKGAPSAVVVRDRSTVWVSVRPLDLTSGGMRENELDRA